MSPPSDSVRWNQWHRIGAKNQNASRTPISITTTRTIPEHTFRYPEAKARQLLERAGITLNGSRRHDIQVHDPKTYDRIFAKGSLGLGESYMDGWWDCCHLDEFFHRIFMARLEREVSPALAAAFARLRATIVNLQRKSRAFRIGEAHYDIGNELYRAMLDTRLTYTCGYWRNAHNLDEAQEAKLDLVCRKIGLRKGDKLLDIGCGWGSLAKFAAEKYGANVVGITVSNEQAQLARELCRGLDVEIRLQDYRDVSESFDHIVSLGMFEHVGVKNYRRYFEIVRKSLRPDGLFLLHTIGNNESTTTIEPWIEKYIFPNSMLPSARQISAASEGLFILEDWHNFGADYDKTLMAWHRNFENAWPKLRFRYDERFHRMWRYYLLLSAANFRARRIQLWQIVMSLNGVTGGYSSHR